MTEQQQARRLVKETLEKPFNREGFIDFIKNLLKKIDEKTFTYNGNLIFKSFQKSIKTLERIGKYEDSNGKKIDILIVQLKKDSSLDRARSTQRNFIGKYLRETRSKLKDGALVAFVSPNNKDWRFSFVKIDYSFTKEGKVKEDLTSARRYSFLVGENEQSHTAQSRLAPYLITNQNPSLEDLEQAFSIEKVSTEFFENYKELFHQLTEALEKIKKSNKEVKEDFENRKIKSDDFSKKLLGQIVFLYFLQKKGWFGVKKNEEWGTGSKHFLRELFNRKDDIYKGQGSDSTKNFFNNILEPLFYEALAGERPDDYHAWLHCRIPFLNGGLFEPINGYRWERTDILLPDRLFSNKNKTTEGDKGDGILDIFDRYNFTVREDEPLEKEVAIDPEMLGQVFENLLEIKDRKSKGAYYTPREIVHYMCQESLINYLAEEFKGKIQKSEIETLIKHGEDCVENEVQTASQTKETKTYSYKFSKNIRKHASLIDQSLANIKICDPAVGSGAFPVGMMSEIIKARDALTSSMKVSPKNRSPYHFKRHAIEHCLYGVDIDSGAIEIAKLRLWLSLIVDEEDRNKVQPLPNLYYKIVCGNSLLGVEKNLFNNEDFKKLEELKPLYVNEPQQIKKNKLKEQIEQIIGKLTKGKKIFDFELYFSEVFRKKKGFDVVIANPPYVQLQKKEGKLAKIYQSQNYQTFSRTGDIYMLFYEKGLQILKSKGVLHFITSNKWMRANYGQKLRDYFSLNTKIISLLDMGADVFNKATVDTNVLLLKNQKNPKFENFKAVNFLNTKNHDSIDQYIKENGIDIPQPKPKETWIIINSSEQKLKQKIENTGIALKDWGIKIFRGVITGYNKAFIIDNETRKKLIDKDPDSTKIIKPILRGKDINFYNTEWKKLWLIDTHNGYNNFPPIDIKNYKAIKNYLDRFYPQLKKRQDKGFTPYNLRSCAYLDEFEKEKIVFQEIVRSPSFSYDKENFYCADTSRFITGKNLKFLLSILNSKLFFYSVKHFYGGGTLGNKGVRMKHTFFQHFPVPKISKKEQKPFINLVDNILAITKTKDYLQNPTKPAQVQKHEKEINQLVYKLYNLTPKEIKIIEKIIHIK